MKKWHVSQPYYKTLLHDWESTFFELGNSYTLESQRRRNKKEGVIWGKKILQEINSYRIVSVIVCHLQIQFWSKVYKEEA